VDEIKREYVRKHKAVLRRHLGLLALYEGVSSVTEDNGPLVNLLNKIRKHEDGLNIDGILGDPDMYSHIYMYREKDHIVNQLYITEFGQEVQALLVELYTKG
jgi:hypothetical protein